MWLTNSCILSHADTQTVGVRLSDQWWRPPRRQQWHCAGNLFHPVSLQRLQRLILNQKNWINHTMSLANRHVSNRCNSVTVTAILNQFWKKVWNSNFDSKGSQSETSDSLSIHFRLFWAFQSERTWTAWQWRACSELLARWIRELENIAKLKTLFGWKFREI